MVHLLVFLRSVDEAQPQFPSPCLENYLRLIQHLILIWRLQAVEMVLYFPSLLHVIFWREVETRKVPVVGFALPFWSVSESTLPKELEVVILGLVSSKIVKKSLSLNTVW